MARSKAAPKGANRPSGSGTSERRSGQGSGSALREMLRRQAQSPKPDEAQAGPAGREAVPPGPQPPNRKRQG